MSAIIEFVSGAIDLGISVATIFVNTIKSAVTLIKTLPSLVSYLLDAVGYMPLTIYPYILMAITAIVIWSMRKAL